MKLEMRSANLMSSCYLRSFDFAPASVLKDELFLKLGKMLHLNI